MWELLAPLFGKVIDKVLPDPAAAAAAKLKLAELDQAGQLEQLKSDSAQALAQLDVDKAEAASTDPLQHWRGALGWVCTFAYFWNFVALPICSFASVAAGHPLALPGLDAQPLYTLTTGMLGLGAYHAYQTIKTQ